MKFINQDVLTFQLKNEPFPHIVLDNFIKKDYLDQLLQDIERLTKDKSYYFGTSDIEKNKYAFKKDFDETLSELFDELNGNEFITILEKTLEYKIL